MNRQFRRTLERLSQHDGLDVTVGEAFALALHHHRAGRIAEAEACYRQILELEPGHLKALNNLGSAVRGQGRLDEAVEIYRRALALKPDLPEALNNLGSALQAKGLYEEAIESFGQAVALNPRASGVYLNLGVVQLLAGQAEAAVASLYKSLDIKPDQVDTYVNLGAALQSLDRNNEAAAAFVRALRFKPNHVLALVNLGNLRQTEGRFADAVACFERAVTIDPDRAEAYFNLGNVLLAQGDHEAAVTRYRRAVGLRPDYAKAHLNLGSALLELGRTEEAVRSFERALELSPQLAMAHMNIGNALLGERRFEEAMARYEEALRIAPSYAEAHMNLGNTLQAMDRPHEALARFRKAVELAPSLAPAHLNLGLALRGQGALSEAQAHYREAIRLRPDYAEAQVGLGMVLLLSGRLEEAWPHYEWRWQIRDWPTQPRSFTAPRWDGSSLAGKTILLHAEQGMGDTIQFASFVPLVAEQAAAVVVQAPAEVLPALRGLPGVTRFVAEDGEDSGALPPFDVHCPLMSLPLALGTTLGSLPSLNPYLRPDPDLSQRWRRRVKGGRRTLKVGLVWGGNPDHRYDRARSMSFDQLKPLLGMPGVAFHSLQVGERAAELARFKAGGAVIDLAPDLTDLGETAAAIQALDLVITVDTVVAHLAGALGRPTWLMLAFAPDWRWLADRDDSPWYPTLRLFRQDRPGNWPGVVDRIAEALRETACADDA